MSPEKKLIKSQKITGRGKQFCPEVGHPTPNGYKVLDMNPQKAPKLVENFSGDHGEAWAGLQGPSPTFPLLAPPAEEML